METLTRLAWIALAAVHLPPAAVLAAPSLARRLYGVDPEGAAGVLIVHRGALFLALAALALWAVFDPALRRAASLALGLSIGGFLVLYLRTGAPPGALRTIALADAAVLVPLAWGGVEGVGDRVNPSSSSRSLVRPRAPSIPFSF